MKNIHISNLLSVPKSLKPKHNLKKKIIKNQKIKNSSLNFHKEYLTPNMSHINSGKGWFNLKDLHTNYKQLQDNDIIKDLELKINETREFEEK